MTLTGAPAHNPANRQSVLDAIRSLTREHGYAPTVREIRKATGIASSQTVKYHLDALKRDGKIDFVPHSPRTIRLVKR